MNRNKRNDTIIRGANYKQNYCKRYRKNPSRNLFASRNTVEPIFEERQYVFAFETERYRRISRWKSSILTRNGTTLLYIHATCKTVRIVSFPPFRFRKSVTSLVPRLVLTYSPISWRITDETILVAGIC